MTKKRLSSFFLILVIAFLYAPILFLVIYSFNSGENMVVWQGFSLKHYADLFADDKLLGIAFNTIIVAIISSVISTLIGTLGAIWINEIKLKTYKNTILNLNNILLVSPDVIIGSSFLALFTFAGLSLGFVSVLLSHIAFSIPIVVLMVLPKLEDMPRTYVTASQDLGATYFQTLRFVVFPYILPGIFAGFFMALTYSLDDFAVTFFVTGNNFSTLAVEIYSRAKQGIDLEVNALSGIMFVFSLVLAGIYYLIINSPKIPKGETTFE